VNVERKTIAGGKTHGGGTEYVTTVRGNRWLHAGVYMGALCQPDHTFALHMLSPTERSFYLQDVVSCSAIR